MTDIASRFHRLSDAFEQTLAAVPDDAWERPSPCAGWSARDVVGHVVDVHGMMLRPVGRELSAAPSVAEDPLEAYRSARRDVAAVMDDAELRGTEYDGYFGRTTVGATIDHFLGLDLVVHRWDLATATGQTATMDPADVERIRRDVESFGDAARSDQVFGPALEVGEQASPEERLLAFLGRTPT